MGGGLKLRATTDPEGFPLAEVYTPDETGDGVIYIETEGMRASDVADALPSHRAFADLLAAAPDLLAACEAIDRECLIGKLWSHEAREAVNALRAACRKARGEP